MHHEIHCSAGSLNAECPVSVRCQIDSRPAHSVRGLPLGPSVSKLVTVAHDGIWHCSAFTPKLLVVKSVHQRDWPADCDIFVLRPRPVRLWSVTAISGLRTSDILAVKCQWSQALSTEHTVIPALTELSQLNSDIQVELQHSLSLQHRLSSQRQSDITIPAFKSDSGLSLECFLSNGRLTKSVFRQRQSRPTLELTRGRAHPAVKDTSRISVADLLQLSMTGKRSCITGSSYKVMAMESFQSTKYHLALSTERWQDSLGHGLTDAI